MVLSRSLAKRCHGSFGFVPAGRLLAAVGMAVTLGSATMSQTMAADELMATNSSSRFGLVEAWRHQLDVGVGAQSIVDQKIHVSAANKKTYVELVRSAPDESGGSNAEVVSRISANGLSELGLPLGEDEATRLAKNEQRRLKRRGIETTMRTTSVNDVRIYVLSDRGALEAVDGETGELIWATRFGDPRRQYGTIGCDDEYVVVVNGSEAFVMSAVTGRLLHQRTLESIPLFGPLLADGVALFPGIGGSVEGIYLDDLERFPFTIRTPGTALAPMAMAPGSTKVAWASDRGMTYVMNVAPTTPTLDFRLDTSGVVNGQVATADDDRFFFATSRGQVYALKATREGRVLWNLPLGEPMLQGVFVVGEKLYAPSGYGNLYAIEAASGQVIWENPAPGVGAVIGVVGEYIYVRSTSGVLVVLEVATGKRVANFNSIRPTMVFPNTATDRIYMVSTGGTLQCLRPESAPLPTFRSTPPTVEPAEDEEPEVVDTADDLAVDGMPDSNDEDDPFGGMDDDPFGAGGDSPFGAMDDDPFGAAGF